MIYIKLIYNAVLVLIHKIHFTLSFRSLVNQNCESKNIRQNRQKHQPLNITLSVHLSIYFHGIFFCFIQRKY